jgi:hypothetical protein
LTKGKRDIPVYTSWYVEPDDAKTIDAMMAINGMLYEKEKL